jgi:uncharacterized protein (DUF983 family)
MTVPEGFPGSATLLWRGATKHCPRCGAGHLFRHYFTMKPDCPGCGLHFEREEGYWVGALAVNIAFVFAIFTIAFVLILAFTIPDVPVVPILAVLVPVMVIGPVLFYPWSKTLWMFIDYGFLQRIGS